MKKIKKLMLLVMSCTLLLGMGTVSFAKQKDKTNQAPKKAVCQKVAKVTCTASGKVNISFKNKVAYTDSVSATITDVDGKEIACKISKKNKAMMAVSVKGLVKGQKYTLTIKGVKAKGSNEAADIVKTFTAKGMKTACAPSKVSVAKKKFVTIKFKSSAYYKDAVVTVKDSEGNLYEAKIIKKAKGNIKIQVKGLKKGQKYTVTVTGIKTKKEKNYSSITKTFTAK